MKGLNLVKKHAVSSFLTKNIATIGSKRAPDQIWAYGSVSSSIAS